MKQCPSLGMKNGKKKNLCYLKIFTNLYDKWGQFVEFALRVE